MIGIFLLDNKNDIALFQYGKHKDIAALHFHAHNNMCAAELMSGEEEFFDDAMFEIVADSLKSHAHALIAHIDDTGACLTQYSVKIHNAA